MLAEDILKHPARAMTPAQRASYFDNGFTLLPSFVEAEWLERLNAAIARFIEESRTRTHSDSVYDIEPDHTAENPRLRRVSSPCDQDRHSGSSSPRAGSRTPWLMSSDRT